jgi:hypothetical protein
MHSLMLSLSKHEGVSNQQEPIMNRAVHFESAK